MAREQLLEEKLINFLLSYFSTGGNISSNINGNSANNTQNSSSSTIYHLLPSTQPVYTAATSGNTGYYQED